MEHHQLDIYNRATALLEKLDSSFLDLGRLLRTAQEEDKAFFKTLMKLPGLGRRTGYYLVAISRTFDPLPVDDKELAEIGWTRLARIAKFVTPKTMNWLLDLARTHTDRELKLALAGKTPNKKMKVVLLYLRPKQYAAYRAAMLKFGAQEAGRGLAGQEAALMKLISKVVKKK